MSSDNYPEKERLKNTKNPYAGNIIKFEMPQLLLTDDKPAWLHVTAGYHFFGGDSPVNYEMKWEK